MLQVRFEHTTSRLPERSLRPFCHSVTWKIGVEIKRQVETVAQNLWLINDHFTTNFSNFFCHLRKYLSQNWDLDGHFEVLNGSVSQLVKKLWHKMLIFPFLFFTNFVKKTRQNNKINFFSNHHGWRYLTTT